MPWCHTCRDNARLGRFSHEAKTKDGPALRKTSLGELRLRCRKRGIRLCGDASATHLHLGGGPSAVTEWAAAVSPRPDA
jgi:hypothetical protein